MSSYPYTYSASERMAAFLNEMNKKASEVGAVSSKFRDPFGIRNISTAHDIARIMLNASGYPQLYDAWNTPTRTLRLFQQDGTVREHLIESTVVNGKKSHILGDKYRVLGGKTGTVPGVFNLAVLCQSNKDPDDSYIVVILKADASDKENKNRFQAAKEVMDYIESESALIAEPDLLDEIAWEGLSYRDIFIKRNLLPELRKGQIGNGLIISGAPQVILDNQSKTYSLKCFGNISQQLKLHRICSEYPYFVGSNVRIDRYERGCCGVMFAKNYAACHSGVTDGWVTSARILRDNDGAGNIGKTRIHIGSGKRADLDGYIKTPVVIPLSIFKNPPSEEKMTELYQTYSDRLQQITASCPVICAEHVYALKLPRQNGRAFRNIEIDPVIEKNSYIKITPASTTKLLTSILLLDHIPDLNEKVLITQDDIDAVPYRGCFSKVFRAGDTVTYRDLLYAMYLPSDNVACCVVAHNVGERILKRDNP